MRRFFLYSLIMLSAIATNAKPPAGDCSARSNCADANCYATWISNHVISSTMYADMVESFFGPDWPNDDKVVLRTTLDKWAKLDCTVKYLKLVFDGSNYDNNNEVGLTPASGDYATSCYTISLIKALIGRYPTLSSVSLSKARTSGGRATLVMRVYDNDELVLHIDNSEEYP